MSVCVCVCLSVTFCDKRDIPQYLSQMKSDLHEIFSVLKDWSPELIKSVRARARARVHAQDVETCTQLWAKNKPSYFK